MKYGKLLIMFLLKMWQSEWVQAEPWTTGDCKWK